MRLRIFSICLCIVLFLSGCGPFSADAEEEKPVTQSSFCLNTSVSITLYGEEAEELIEECFRLCGEYEAIFSRTLEDSELYAINHRAKGTRELTVSDHMAALLEEALTYCRLSECF